MHVTPFGNYGWQAEKERADLEELEWMGQGENSTYARVWFLWQCVGLQSVWGVEVLGHPLADVSVPGALLGWAALEGATVNKVEWTMFIIQELKFITEGMSFLLQWTWEVLNFAVLLVMDLNIIHIYRCHCVLSVLLGTKVSQAMRIHNSNKKEKTYPASLKAGLPLMFINSYGKHFWC